MSGTSIPISVWLHVRYVSCTEFCQLCDVPIHFVCGIISKDENLLIECPDEGPTAWEQVEYPTQF